jgi:hypothetical protein
MDAESDASQDVEEDPHGHGGRARSQAVLVNGDKHY